MTDDNCNREVYLLAFSGMFYHPRLGGVVTGHIVESPQTAAVHYRGVAYQVLTPGGESQGETHRGVFIEDEVDPPVQETADMYREIFERGNARIEQAHHNETGEVLIPEYRGNNEWRVGPWTVTWREHNRIGHAPEWWAMHMGRPHHIADRGRDAVKWARENAYLLED